MDEYFTFQKGDLAGKTVEQLAIEDYRRLWVLNNNVLPPGSPFKKRVEEVLYALDNFHTKMFCTTGLDSCCAPAKNLLLGKFDAEISASVDYLCCDAGDCKSAVMYEGVTLLPIKFSILSSAQLNLNPKVYDQIRSVLLKCAEAPKKATKENAKKWIDDILWLNNNYALPQKLNAPQKQ